MAKLIGYILLGLICLTQFSNVVPQDVDEMRKTLWNDLICGFAKHVHDIIPKMSKILQVVLKDPTLLAVKTDSMNNKLAEIRELVKEIKDFPESNDYHNIERDVATRRCFGVLRVLLDYKVHLEKFFLPEDNSDDKLIRDALVKHGVETLKVEFLKEATYLKTHYNGLIKQYLESTLNEEALKLIQFKEDFNNAKTSQEHLNAYMTLLEQDIINSKQLR